MAGVMVSPDTVMSIGCYYSGVYVIASGISAIPFQVVKRDGSSRLVDYAHPYHDLISHEPNEDIDALGMFGAIMWHLLTRGNAYVQIQRDNHLRPFNLILLDPTKVHPKRHAVTRELYYLTTDGIVLKEDMIHVANISFDGLVGASPVTYCRETLGLTKAVEIFGASNFGNGINQKGVFTTAQRYDDIADAAMRKKINDVHQGPYNANKPLFLWNGLAFNPTQLTAEDAQFLGARGFQVEEICRILNLAPTKLQAWAKANYASLEEAESSHYSNCLLPWIRRIESAFNRKLFSKIERRIWSIVHDTDSSMRGRILDQANSDKILFDMGAINDNEIRAKRGMGPVKGGETHFVPLNCAPLDKVATATIQELKGLTTDAKPSPGKADPPADAPGDEVNVTADDTDGEVIAAARAVVFDVAKRMCRREANAVRKIAGKRDIKAIVEGLDEFYRDQTRTLTEAYAPALAVYSAASGVPIDPEHFAGERTLDMTAVWQRCLKSPESQAAFSREFQASETTRPNSIVNSLLYYDKNHARSFQT
jgi:HK97 family phage portal protein